MAIQVFHSLENLPKMPHPVVTIGAFDGVHLGHVNVLKRLTDYAKSIAGTSLVFTFDPHPRQLLYPNETFLALTSTEEKIQLFERYGVAGVIVFPFTKEFSQLPYNQFITDILIAKIGVKAIVMGPNHSFGKNRQGNHENMVEICRKMGVDVVEISEFEWHDSKIRSSEIRKLIAAGDITKAEQLLGHPFSQR